MGSFAYTCRSPVNTHRALESVAGRKLSQKGIMKKRVLVVDDEPHLLEALRFKLEGAGYEVLAEADGKDALDLVKAERPDLVVIDLHLPTMNGDEVCREMKSDDALKSIPVILFTATGAAEIEEKAAKAGSDAYLVKPFEHEVLLTKMRELIG